MKLIGKTTDQVLHYKGHQTGQLFQTAYGPDHKGQYYMAVGYENKEDGTSTVYFRTSSDWLEEALTIEETE